MFAAEVLPLISKLSSLLSLFCPYHSSFLSLYSDQFSESDDEIMRQQLEKRQGALIPSRPAIDTKLYK